MGRKGAAHGREGSRRTVRARLATSYGALFLGSVAALVVLTALLWGRATSTRVAVSARVPARIIDITAAGAVALGLVPPGGVSPALGGPARAGLPRVPPVEVLRKVTEQLRIVAAGQQSSDLHQLLLYSGIALALTVVLAAALGWVSAGRVLRPLRAITNSVRDISASNLHERLALAGPDDELKQLGDTFDGLLERLERSFQAQRLFVANASHELRTPLATMRAALDVAVAKPGPVPPPLATLAERFRVELDGVDRLLEGLLVLARAERGPAGLDTPLALDQLVASAIARRERPVTRLGLAVDAPGCADAWVSGNATLLTQLVENLLDNAVRHNEPGGFVRVRTGTRGSTAVLVVENSGQVLDGNGVVDLVQPFRRAGTERTGSDGGFGLGLSIVAAVADAHGGSLALTAIAEGGLRVEVDLPLAARPARALPEGTGGAARP
ncbi:MAG: HAMP domain-containing sensor histidine kinase [Actinomycetota bacterium]|nr:HAMP domain-containing sensor histidine kinase [Actinomycetota bacterium]